MGYPPHFIPVAERESPRAADGARLGRPPTHILTTSVCPRCQSAFTYKRYPGREHRGAGLKRRFCSAPCRGDGHVGLERQEREKQQRREKLEAICNALDGMVNRGLPPEIREDAINEVAIQLLDGLISPEAAREALGRAVKTQIRQYKDKFRSRSLDATDETGRTLLDKLEADDLSEWR